VQGQARISRLDLAPGFKDYRGHVRISELAERVGVATSTVRYYERIGLLSGPSRTASGYRDYDEDDAARLLFVTRARRLGLSCDDVGSLLGIWAGTHCANAAERVSQLIDQKQAEIAARVLELQGFAAQLDAVAEALRTAPPPEACRTDLTCCVPESREPVVLDLVPRPH
jgi:DNA-binding transcriptional MerR regulator